MSAGSENHVEGNGNTVKLKPNKPQRRRRKKANPAGPGSSKPVSDREITELVDAYKACSIHKAQLTTNVTVAMPPSDPDFPFDIQALRFHLMIPHEYPNKPPRLKVLNESIPRGHAANVELGFYEIATECLGKTTLLGMTDSLNKRLEQMLSQEKQPTVKFVKYSSKTSPTPEVERNKMTRETKTSSSDTQSGPKARQKLVPVPRAATKKREKDLDMMKSRLRSAVSLAANSDEGQTYEIRIKADPSLTESSEGLRLHLLVPKAYGHEPCKITRILDSHSPNVQHLMTNFNTFSRASKHWSILALLNYLATNARHLSAPYKMAVSTAVSTGPVDSSLEL